LEQEDTLYFTHRREIDFQRNSDAEAAAKCRGSNAGPKLPSVGWHSGGSHAPGRDFSGHTWRGQNARTRALGQGNWKNRKRRKSGRGKIGESLVPRPRAGGRDRRTSSATSGVLRAADKVEARARSPDVKITLCSSIRAPRCW